MTVEVGDGPDAPIAASSSCSNSRQVVIDELTSVHISGLALCQEATRNLMPFLGYLDGIREISGEVRYLSKYSMRVLTQPMQDLFPPRKLTEIKSDADLENFVSKIYLDLYRACYAARLLYYLIRHIKITYDINREAVKLANQTIPFLIQAERTILSLLQNSFSPYRGDILEPLEDIFYGLRRRDYKVLRNYLNRQGITGDDREKLIQNIEGLVIGARQKSSNTPNDAPRLIRPVEIEEIKRILVGWDKDASLYRGRVFDWIQEKLKDYIPGLMPKHLTSHKPLYNTYNKAIARHGVPTWMLPTTPDEDEDPVAVLARFREGERARARRFYAAKRGQPSGSQPR